MDTETEARLQHMQGQLDAAHWCMEEAVQAAVAGGTRASRRDQMNGFLQLLRDGGPIPFVIEAKAPPTAAYLDGVEHYIKRATQSLAPHLQDR